MKVIKEKQFLIFYLDSGKTCRYDLSTGETYGFSGKKVKSINTQLRGYTIKNIIDSIENESYKEFLSFISMHYTYATNFGSLLTEASNHLFLEQYFTAGINPDVHLSYKISEIPKGLIKYCQSSGIILNNRIISLYKDNPDIVNQIIETQLTNFTTNDIITKISYISSRYLDYGNKFLRLIKDYSYSTKSLLHYIDNLYSYEAVERSFEWFITEIYDYVIQASKLSRHYEKYPRNFLTTHTITNRNYRKLKQHFDEEAFYKIYTENHSYLEKNISDYSFIYPKKIQDIKDEAVQQSNCVASYIDRVLDNQCHIMFLRKKDNPKKSLVTLEVRDNKIVQARGPYNRMPTEEEKEVIHRWEQSVA